jgi:hypothetical protein
MRLTPGTSRSPSYRIFSGNELEGDCRSGIGLTIALLPPISPNAQMEIPENHSIKRRIEMIRLAVLNMDPSRVCSILLIALLKSAHQPMKSIERSGLPMCWRRRFAVLRAE